MAINKMCKNEIGTTEALLSCRLPESKYVQPLTYFIYYIVGKEDQDKGNTYVCCNKNVVSGTTPAPMSAARTERTDLQTSKNMGRMNEWKITCTLLVNVTSSGILSFSFWFYRSLRYSWKPMWCDAERYWLG